MATFNPNGRKKVEPYPSVFTPPAGREIAGGFVDPKYGAGTVTRSAGSSVAAPASSGAAPLAPYTPPTPAAGAAPFPETPPADDGSNIIEGDFQTPTDYEAEAAQQDETVDSLDAREAAAQAKFAAALAGAKQFREQPGAIDIPVPAAELAAPPNPTPTAPTPRKSSFTPGAGFPKTPITFEGSSPWASGDEVGFNDASVEKANPGWTGKASWTSQASMGGGYDGSVNAAASRATPDQPHKWATQTEKFYDRAAARGDYRRVNKFNSRRGI